jgi:hypothetical protein
VTRPPAEQALRATAEVALFDSASPSLFPGLAVRKGGVVTASLTCSAYPATSRKEAERRANVTAREDGRTILDWDWHPDPTRRRGRAGGVLVVRFCQPPRS